MTPIDRHSLTALRWHPLAIWPATSPSPTPPRKSATIAWLLWLLGGWLGAHRFYLGRWLSGFVYLASFGVFGLGMLIDAFLLPSMVRDANATAAPVFVVGTAAMPVPLPVPAVAHTPPAMMGGVAPSVPPSVPPPRRCEYCGTMAAVAAHRCGECGAAVSG